MEKYYTADEVENGIEGLPPISKTTLRNLRLHRKLKYTKLGNKTFYLKSWIEEYLLNNIVETRTA